MITPETPMKKLIMIASLSLLGSLIPTISHADTETYATPNQQGYQTNEQDQFSTNGLNPFDLMHRANFMNNQFSPQNSEQQLNTAADDFKRLQQERLKQQLQQQNGESNLIPLPQTPTDNSLDTLTLPTTTP